MVDIMCQLNPILYMQYVILENGRRVSYTEVHTSVYGMVDSDLLFWMDLLVFLEKQVYVMNLYGIYSMNNIINRAQCTIV